MSDYDWPRHLQEDEELLWQGRPNPKYRLIGNGWDLFFVPFGGFSFAILLSLIFLSLDAGDRDADTQEGLLLVPHLLFAAVLAFGHQWVDQRLRVHKRYAVTNRRVLSASAKSGLVVFEHDIGPDLSLVPIHGWNASIRLSTKAPSGHHQARSGSSLVSSWVAWNWQFAAIMFTGHERVGDDLRLLSDSKKVLDLIRCVRAQNAEGAA